MWVYNLVVFLYGCSIKAAGLFHKKARLWSKGRKDIFTHIEKTMREKIGDGPARVIWVHCASLGEFEQGRPVIEKLKARDKKIKIVLTFFSPSGYEIRKDYELADAVFYLPLDSKKHAEQFISLVKPAAAVFVKYEFWLNYINELNKKEIPTYLISAVFRSNQHFFKPYGKMFLSSLHHYKKIFLQDENSFQLLKQHGLTNVEVAGDTRFDRVMQIIRTRQEFREIELFCGNSKVIVAGSTWPKDEEVLLGAYKKLKQRFPTLKLLLVPHEVDAATVEAIENLILKVDPFFFFARYSSKQHFDKHDILIVDTIGILSQLYRYGLVGFVGGGFTDGIHSILEAMAYGMPVAFGPDNKKFVEAQDVKRLQIGKEVNNEEQLTAFFVEMLSSDTKRKAVSEQISEYMYSKTGAAEKICAELV